MTVPTALNLLLTFGVFSAVCWRLMHTSRPSPHAAEYGQWLLWGGCHIGIAYAMLVVMLNGLCSDLPGAVHPHFVILKLSLLFLLLVPWRRRSMGDRS